ncbi:MAG TPA: transcriptional regulator, partial [Streptomyces sp.]|nr:transcriptional regulator [Streptomyces sp.]
MPFQMRFRTDTPPRCRFAVSPLREVQEAARTLRRPDRQSRHLPWLRRVRDAAAGLDLTPLWLLMPAGGRGPDFLCPYPP